MVSLGGREPKVPISSRARKVYPAMRVLLVEDDRTLGDAVRAHVASLGDGVDWMTRLRDAKEALASAPYELVLLDLGLPDGCGLELLRTLRQKGTPMPVIILTAQDQIAARIEGLNSGADDYLVKPFDLDELSARVAAVVRRCAGHPNPLLRLGDAEIDLARRFASAGGQTVSLTAREWAVLERLIRGRDATVTKAAIEESLYEFGAEIESNAVEVYVSRLRKKLGREAIRTIRGVGYRAGV